MARMTKSISFKSATINLQDMTVTEVLKDSTTEFDLMDALKEWDGIEGVSITIKKDSDYEGIEGGE